MCGVMAITSRPQSSTRGLMRTAPWTGRGLDRTRERGLIFEGPKRNPLSTVSNIPILDSYISAIIIPLFNLVSDIRRALCISGIYNAMAGDCPVLPPRLGGDAVSTRDSSSYRRRGPCRTPRSHSLGAQHSRSAGVPLGPPRPPFAHCLRRVDAVGLFGAQRLPVESNGLLPHGRRQTKIHPGSQPLRKGSSPAHPWAQQHSSIST